MLRPLLLIALLLPPLAHAGSDGWLAVAHPGKAMQWQGHVPPEIARGKVPLGSLWKLFTWVYLVGNNAPDTPYLCPEVAAAGKGDEYCCEPGQRVARDLALTRSCGAYFARPRFAVLQPQPWRDWWLERVPQSTWLHDIDNLRPDFALPVADILTALRMLPAKERDLARDALLGRLMQPAWQDFLRDAGSGYRFKTFTWQNPHAGNGTMLGGAAGWLPDGTVFWIGGQGRSVDVLHAAAQTLPSRLPMPDGDGAVGGACVDVGFFTRYPVERILDSEGRTVATDGKLNGRYTLYFPGGNTLAINAAGRLTLEHEQGQPRISGRFPLEEYIARVVDREADAREPAAARALAIAARSWLLQNARFGRGCWQVDDDTRAQRVSANLPSPAAWRVAWSTEGLHLAGQPVLYHRDSREGGRLSWRDAVAQSRRGADYVQILADAFPRATFADADGGNSCQALPEAEQWLQRRSPRLVAALAGEPGFEPPGRISVCRLDYGNPYSDQRQQRIWVRALASRNDRLALLHEYLHIAFRHHPAGHDENHVEALARRLEDTL